MHTEKESDFIFRWSRNYLTETKNDIFNLVAVSMSANAQLS